MRRYVLPAVVLAIVIAASVLAGRANDAAAPDDPPDVETSSLATPLLNVRRAPEWLRQPSNDNLLERAVLAAMDTLSDGDAACLSVHRDGQVIAESNADTPLVPGRLQRLMTLAAFDTLGSAAYTTEVVRSSEHVVTDGVLEGDLWLLGGADPVLSTAQYVDRFGDDRASTSMEELALSVVTALREQGITEINGSIVGDESRYTPNDRVYGDNTWTRDDIATNVVGPMSALLLDNGFDAFPEVPDPPANDRAGDPALHAARAITSLIEIGGIEVSNSATVGVRPETLQQIPLASIDSPPLGAIAARALLDGTTAEMMFREIGQRDRGEASQLNSLVGVPGRLVEAGVLDDAGVVETVALDGSGLSLGDRGRCDAITTVLDQGTGALVVDALPSVENSILASCAPGGPESLHVYSAAREELTAMGGRAVASNGDVITFSAIVNWGPPDPEADPEAAPRGACDSILPALLDAIGAHPAGPGLSQLMPLPVAATS